MRATRLPVVYLILLVLLAGIGLQAGGSGADGGLETVQIGDTWEAVLEKAGPPGGQVQAGAVLVCLYTGGKIRIEEGVVSSVELKDPERELERLNRLAVAEEIKTARDLERIERGEAVKAAKLADPQFRIQPAEVRLDYWIRFNRLYPEVDIVAQVEAISRQMEREQTWELFLDKVAEANRRSPAFRRVYRIPGSYMYPGRHYYRREPEKRVQPERRAGGIIEYENTSLFTPGLGKLPGGTVPKP